MRRLLIYEAKVPSKVINSYFGLIICILYHIITYEDRIYILHLLNTRNIIRYSKLIANDEA
jgi:nicotinamide riboside transporter PnuC